MSSRRQIADSVARTILSKRRVQVDGARLLYAYLQKDLLLSDVWLFQMLTARLIVDLGIWLPPRVYRCLPLLVPHAVRDPGSRGDRAKGIPDQWGSPNPEGVFRDDNSLVKGIPRSLRIESARNVYRDGVMEKGFVASHVWRRLSSGLPSTRERLTYSFVPNLVWLPSDVAKLTDREGSFVQGFVQAIAAKVYRDSGLTASMTSIVEPIWQVLPQSSGIPPQALPRHDQLNFFVATPAWLIRRLETIKHVCDALESARQGAPLPAKVVSSRYTAGLPTVAPASLSRLHDELGAYVVAAEEAISVEARHHASSPSASGTSEGRA